MPYQYSTAQNPYALSIADILARRGDVDAQRATSIATAQAQAAQASGQAWGRAIGEVGQTLGAIPQQIAQQKKSAQQDELGRLQLDEAQRKAQAQKAVEMLPFYASGQGRQAQLAALDGPARELAMSHYQQADEAQAKLDQIAASTRASNLNAEQSQQQIDAAKMDVFGALAAGVKAHNYEPGAFFAATADAVHKNLIPLDQAGPMVAHAIQNPNWIKSTTDELIARSPQQQALEEKRAAEARMEQQAKEASANTAADNRRADEQLDLARQREAREAKQAGDVTHLTPGGLDMAALNYRKTGVMPALGNGDKETRKQIIDRAAALTSTDITRIEAGGVDVAANKATYKSDADSLTNVTKTLDTLTAFENTAGKNLKQFTDLAAKIPDTGVPWLNTPVRLLNRQLVGDSNQAAAEAARTVALREIARVTNDPKLSGVLSDSARQEVLGLNPQNATFAQIKAVAKVLQQDMANVHTSLSAQREAIQGRIGGTHTGAPPATTAPKAPAGWKYVPKAGGGWTAVEDKP